ncbi:uncharacterized protein ZBIST_4388 [Zygosaccharomyces bailii]|nr:uncharacterized protein ZBIST_4388 [Zygosaccharomyces bailii]
MAKTIRKRGKSGGSCTAAASKVAASAATPQIQELQDLMDSQQHKIDAVKEAYSQQNSQLAKCNSSLMMKMTDFEKKISELLQENVILRSKVSMSETNYKKRLNQQISILEEGISQRFEEIFHMFNRVRRNENLPTANNNANEPKPLLRTKRSRPSSGRASSIHFQTDETSEPRISEQTQAKRKRRNSRRESLFLPGDFEFTSGGDLSPLGQPEQQPAFELGQPSAEQVLENQPIEYAETHAAEQTQITEDYLNNSITQDEDGDNGSLSFANSLIDYSIPEETAATGRHFNTEVEVPTSSSKLEIFKDEPKDETRKQAPETSTTEQRNANDTPFIPLETSQSKVKHSLRPLNTKSTKKKFDEVMPSTNSNGACDLNFPRTRRTRGKTIDYTLPSLRAKMRRPSEKLVDATTFTNIQDLQVTHSDKKSSKSNSRKSTMSPDPMPIQRLQQEESQSNTDFIRSATQKKSLNNSGEQNHKQEIEKSDDTKNEPIPNHSIENSGSPEYKASSTDNSSGFCGKPLKDITNTPKPKSTKTKKLLKNAIINDLCDRPDDINSSSSERSVSFRLHEEDLSVFDLIGSDKAKHPQKTYRARSRKKTNSRE